MTLTAFHARYQPEAAAAARQFVQDWPHSRSLVLLGKPGTGKTHLAVGVLLALADRGVYGRYVHVPSLLAELRRATDQRDAERRHLEPLFSAPVIALDDAGREKVTEHWMQWIDVLVNDRWVNEQPIIITANLDMVGLTQWLGGASASRLLSEALPITMREGDMRRVQLPPPPAAASGDPTKPCGTCAGAGWVLDERVPVGRRERLMQCPSCSGRGY